MFGPFSSPSVKLRTSPTNNTLFSRSCTETLLGVCSGVNYSESAYTIFASHVVSGVINGFEGWRKDSVLIFWHVFGLGKAFFQETQSKSSKMYCDFHVSVLFQFFRTSSMVHMIMGQDDP